jgi:hypothetical protein
LRGSAVEDLSPLTDLLNLEYLSLGNSSIRDVVPLRNLLKLKDLNLSQTSVADVRPLGNLTNLSTLSLGSTRVENISALENMRRLVALDLSSTAVHDVESIEKLNNLLLLNLDLSQVADLLPLANLVSLVKGARSRHYFQMSRSFTQSGLSFSKCPLLDPDLLRLSRVHDEFKRTVDTITHLRRRRGLPPLTDSELLEEELDPKGGNKFDRLRPIENVPSPFAFRLSVNGSIALAESFSNFPSFPNSTSKAHHAGRLDACRVLAGDLISELDSKKFQARFEYGEMLRRYESRLPAGPSNGNILLADAEARTLRNLFAAEAEILSPPLASKLKTFLEQHMGLRVFYPEIMHFYRDVQSGRIDIPLPLDAVDAFVREVKANSPNVFDESVTSAIQGSSEPAAIFSESPVRDLQQEHVQPLPPRDPLGEIDAKKSRDFTFAGAANGLWKTFLEGQKIHRAVEGWKATGEALYPHVNQLIDWLRQFLSSGDGTPPLPPTLGV